MKSLLLVALIAPLTTACVTDTTDRTLRLAAADGSVELPRDELAWSVTGGSASVTAPAAVAYPSRLTIKLDILRAVDGGEVDDAITLGSIEIVEGSACRLTRAARCDGRDCLAEVELTQPGVCLVRARAATPDGEELAQCWYHAHWEGDRADQAAVDALIEMAEQQRATCEDAL
ncbi:MAG: hypothetical protein IPL61_20570 [Myxococcales bacterium]|nr:hypothetical protein [Myxococcales bacterium]